jgi:uncharacterized protein involved in response to NO
MAGPAVLSAGFRPFFLLSALWACLAIPLWLAAYSGATPLPAALPPPVWHAHEMVFGFATATVAGFLLTAIPNWTGRMPLQGWPLAMLVLLWLVGRAAVFLSTVIGTSAAAALDLAFPTVFLGVIAREIIAGRNWRNLPMLAVLALLLAGNALVHVESIAAADTAALGNRLGIATLLMLISLVGGRIIPSFTRNWLFKRKSSRLPSPQDMLDTAAVALLAAALILWAFLPDHRVTGALLIAAALLNAVRLGRWAGMASWPEPLLVILHIGYGWVAVGTALLGLSIFNIGVPVASAIHALTAGATAIMILAVMPRVTLGHTGRELTANRATVAVFCLINAAAIIRVCASWHTEFMTILLLVAGACWIAAFGLFELVYGPMLLTRRSAS